MPTNLQKGKFGELWVFGNLINKGASVYAPIVDEEGVDAIIRKKDGPLVEIQVKSTRAKNQAGYFNVKAKKLHPKCNLFIVCVDMSPMDATPARQPEVWIFPSKEFVKYATLTSDEFRLALPDGNLKYGKPLTELLAKYYEAWPQLTG